MRNIFFNKKFSGITETNPGFFDGWGLGEGLNVKVDKQEIVYPTLHEKNQNEANSVTWSED